MKSLLCELKRAVYERNPTNFEGLEQHFSKKWNKVGLEKFKILIPTYLERLESVNLFADR